MSPFDELRLPASLALRVTFIVSARPLSLKAVFTRSLPLIWACPIGPLIVRLAHSGIRPAHCVAPGAGSELIVLVFEQDVERGE